MQVFVCEMRTIGGSGGRRLRTSAGGWARLSLAKGPRQCRDSRALLSTTTIYWEFGTHTQEWWWCMNGSVSFESVPDIILVIPATTVVVVVGSGRRRMLPNMHVRKASPSNHSARSFGEFGRWWRRTERRLENLIFPICFEIEILHIFPLDLQWNIYFTTHLMHSQQWRSIRINVVVGRYIAPNGGRDDEGESCQG